MRLESDDPDAWLELTPIARASVAAAVESGALVYPEAERDTDVVVILAKNRLEELRVLHSPVAPAVSRYRIRTGPAIREVRQGIGTLEAIDVHGRLAIRSLPAFAVDARGVRRDLILHLEKQRREYVMSLTLNTEGLEYPVLVDPEFVPGPGWPHLKTVTALNSMWLAGPPPSGAHTVNGDVAVLDAAPGTVLNGNAELYLDAGSVVNGKVWADRIEFEPTAQVLSSWRCNEVTPAGPTCFPFSLPLEATVPAIPEFDAGTDTVSDGFPCDETRLEGGDHGDVEVTDGCLGLWPAVHNFASLTMADGTWLVCACEPETPCTSSCEVRIRDRLLVGYDSFVLGSSAFDGVAPLEIIVTGTNAQPDELDTPPLAAEFKSSTQNVSWVWARVFVPNGTLSIGEGAEVIGRLVARDVKIGAGTTVSSDPDAEMAPCEEYCDLAVGKECPADLETCIAECEDALTFGYCQYQRSELVNCTVKNVGLYGANYHCDGNYGVLVADGCEHHIDYLNECLTVCDPSRLDDGDPCTHDYCTCTPHHCDNDSVQHVYASYGTSCSDGNSCNGTEICNDAGLCMNGVPPTLSDGNQCTQDSCSPTTGVQHSPLTSGTACSDGDSCNGNEVCNGTGTCQAGTGGPTVDDGNPNTIDLCNPANGTVTHTTIPTTPQTGFDSTVATDVFDSTEFLYTGSNPPQTGVQANTISRVRASVIRGHVREPDQTPSGKNLPGVTVRILNHAEFGTTFTQLDGWFSLVVNGGGPLTVVFEKTGYMPVHRQVDIAWSDYAFTEEVVMKLYDPNVTTIQLGSVQSQVARGSIVNDEFGSRQATLIVEPGTAATMHLPNNTTQPLTTMNVRLTEYTNGATGRDAMPAGLPPATGYTYAVELSVDEAVAASATKVSFNKWVVVYLENYREFTQGNLMPLGYYDRQLGVWVPMGDGLIVKVLGVQDGMARIDVDGDNIEDPAAYATVGITDVERYEVAKLYVPGQTLWRVALDHFTPADLNAGIITDGECVAGNESTGCGPLPPPHTSPTQDCASTVPGSVIECENQVVGQRIPLTGTPYALHYQSDRTPGREAPYHLEIPIIGDYDLPPLVRQILVEVKVAGQYHKWVALDCATDPECGDRNVVEHWTWDGKDWAGRRVQGPQLATVRVGYTFRRQWQTQIVWVSGGSDGGGGGGGGGQEWGFGGPQGAPTTFGAWPEDASFTVEESGSCGAPPYPCWWVIYAVWTTSRVAMGAWSSLPFGLGGFSIDAHHGYSPIHRTLFLGDGRRRSDSGKGAVIDTFAGGGSGFVDGAPAVQNALMTRGIDSSPDGTVYFTEQFAGRTGVRRVAPDGTDHVVTAPAPSLCSSSGDGGPASSAHVCYPKDVAVGADGGLFIAEQGTRVRRIGPNGVISTFAGNGVLGYSGDGGPATQAKLNNPESLAVAPNGDVFIAHGGAQPVVRRVNTAGIINTVAGGCTTCSSPTAPFPKLATTIQLFHPAAIETGPDGSLYIADRNQAVVYRVGPDGFATIYAGTYGIEGTAGDYGAAAYATLARPRQLALAPDGSLYIGVEDASVEPGQNQNGVRRVSPVGTITTILGNKMPNSGQCQNHCGIPGPAASAVMDENGFVSALDVGPDGSLYAGSTQSRIYRLQPSMPGLGFGNFAVPSADGGEVYVFDERGRHLYTRDSLTGNELFTFFYRNEPFTARHGLLWKVRDVDGLETVIDHNQGGHPTQITGPYGHITGMSVPDVNGFITIVDPPVVPSYSLAYSSSLPGLLLTFAAPNGNQKSYSYTDGSEPNAGGLAGLLETATNTLGTRTFNRTLVTTSAGDGYDVDLISAEGPTTTYRTIEKADGSRTGTVFFPDGRERHTDQGTNGITTIELDDGTVTTMKRQADPRFEMQAPVPAQLTIATGTAPNRKTLDVKTTRAVTLTPPGTDPLAVDSWTETVCINGSPDGTPCDGNAVGGLKTEYASPEETLTHTTNALRESVTQLDADGRPIGVQITSGMIDIADVDLEYNDGIANPLKKGQLETVSYSFGTESRNYQLGYDNAGNLTSITDPLNRIVSFTPDGATRIVSQTFPDTNVVGFGHDNNDNVTSVDPPGLSTSNQHGFVFNGVDLLDKYTAPNVGLSSHEDKYLYNGDRQLDLVTLNNLGNASTIDPLYDTYGRLDRIDLTPYGGATWTLDYTYIQAVPPAEPGPDEGKLETITSSKDNVTLTFGYDGMLMDQVTWSGSGMPATKSVTFAYDDAFRVTSETVTGQTAVTFAYNDADGLLTAAGALGLTRDPDTGILTDTSITEGTATVTDDITVNPFGELDIYTAKWDADGIAGGEVTKYHVDYDRDALGRVIRKAETVDGGATEYLGYEYDTAGRLWKVYQGTSACDPVSSCTLQATYTYDANGNRNPSTCTYDLQDRLTSCGTTSYLYSEWGALNQKTVSSAITTYEYDLLGNLRKVTPPAPAQPIEYIIDGLDRRVGRKAGGTLEKVWIYRDALNPVAELDGTGNVQAIFVYGTKPHVPDYMIKGGSRYRIITDQLGSVRLVVKVSDGTIAQRIDYDEWGVVVADTAPGFQPFAFAAGLYDSGTGLVRFGARDFDPTIGRWTAKDPIGFEAGDANLYSYVYADPVNRHDPTGLFEIGTFLGAGAAKVGAGLGLATIGAGLAAVGGVGLAVWQGYELWKNLNPEIITNAEEHKKGTRPSTKEKHEKGQRRKGKDQGGEKADPGRRPPRKRPPNHKGPWPPPLPDDSCP